MHPAVTFHTAGLEGLTGVDGDNLNTMEAAAVKEIANHIDVKNVTVDGRDYEGILVVTYTTVFDPSVMPYTTLYVYDTGKIAEAMTNHPVLHRSFRELVEDVRWGVRAGEIGNG